MNESVRKSIAAVSAIVLGVIITVAMIYMPDADEDIASYGLLLADLAVEERNSLNTLSGVLFDLRALDTLGELLILFSASAGLHIILRRTSGEKYRSKPLMAREDRPDIQVSDTIRMLCLSLVAPMLAYGIYICVRGHLTIGGGFQGGVIIASALFLLYLAGYFKVQGKIAHDDIMDRIEVISMGGVLFIGLSGLLLAGSIFENVLPMGVTGELFSAGVIPVLSILVGLESAAALVLIVSHMKSQLLKLEEEA